MSKYKLKKPSFFNDRLYQAGDVVDFGDTKPPKDAEPVEVPAMVQRAAAAKAAAAEAATPAAQVAKEDAVLKGTAK